MIRGKLTSDFLNQNILQYMPQTHGRNPFNTSLVISLIMQQKQISCLVQEDAFYEHLLSNLG